MSVCAGTNPAGLAIAVHLGELMFFELIDKLTRERIIKD